MKTPSIDLKSNTKSAMVDLLNARLAEAIASVKGHAGFAAGPKSKPLQDALGAVERALLMSAREAIHALDVALGEADRPPTAATVAAARW